MKTRQLKVLEQILSCGIRALINGLKIRFVSHQSVNELERESIFAVIDKVDEELKDVPKMLFENSKIISDVYGKTVKDYDFDDPEQLFNAAHNILEDSFVLTLRYAVIYEALQVLPANYSVNQKRDLENSLKTIETGSREIQTILSKIHDVELAKSIHDSILILKASEQDISIEEADKNERKRWA